MLQHLEVNSDIFGPVQGWPYLDTMVRLLLALGLGLIVGLERERRHKEAGVRTFAFAAIAGCVGGMLGDAYAITALLLVVPFIVFLNVDSLRKAEGIELTTSAALAVIVFVGVLCGKGHTFTPVAVSIVVAALLAWKQPIAGFSIGITEAELRSAILLAVLALVIYPVLPSGTIDRWDLIAPRTIWITIILIPGIAFTNYVLLKIFGPRGESISGFLAGLVNSIAAVTQVALCVRDGKNDGATAFRGTMLAASAMFLRNGIILFILAPDCIASGGLAIALMFGVSMALAFSPWSVRPGEAPGAPVANVLSPISLKQGLRFGSIFLAVTVAGTLAQRALGSSAFYVVSGIGGLVSSSSAVASAGQLANHHDITPLTGGIGAIIACIASGIVMIPLVDRIGQSKQLTQRVAAAIAVVTIVGLLATAAAPTTTPWITTARK